MVLSSFLYRVKHAVNRTATCPALDGLDQQHDFFTGCSISGPGLTLQKKHTDIGWNRIKAAAVHNDCTAARGVSLMLINHLPDPLRLASEIAIVCSAFDASGDQFTAILCVRSDSRQYNAAVASQLPERVAITIVRDNDCRLLAGSAISGDDALKLFPVAAGDSPAERGANRIFFGKVFDHELSGEPGGTDNHNVERSIVI